MWGTVRVCAYVLMILWNFEPPVYCTCTVYTYTYTYIHIHTYTYNVYVRVYVCACVRVCEHACMRASMCVCGMCGAQYYVLD